MGALTDDELRRRISLDEDELTEFKATASDTRDIRNTLVAFANSVGDGQTGTLFIGVHKRSAIGVDGGLDELQRKIQRMGKDECYPPIIVTSRALDVQGKQVLAVMVAHSADRPHFSGHAYVRRGSESKKASKEQHEELIVSRLDVCRKIQSLGQAVVSLEAVGKVLGNPRPMPGHHESREVQVQTCDGHSVTVFDISLAQRFNEPLENVVVTHDENKYRPKLLIRFPGRQ